ncbi:hypothetical protein AB0C07_26440 [Actinoplanes missouriensis]|uniref:hypothetical protein n=1 Tax=Actinoplanes missouriensis TaxID=1866 RepID=UPI0033F6AA97
MITFTGPKQPLLRYIREQRRVVAGLTDDYTAMAEAILDDHKRQWRSDRSVYLISSKVFWKRAGTYDEHGHRLTTDDDYVYVGDDDSVEGLATRIAHRVAGHDHRRAVTLLDCAERASPMVEIALAVLLYECTLEWDTDETLKEAARRLALQAAWDAHRRFTESSPLAIFLGVASEFGSSRMPADFAREWLSTRSEIEVWLTRNGIAWGDVSLPAKEAAERAGMAPASWSSITSRGLAPAEDHKNSRGAKSWRPATIDAWMVTTPRRRDSWNRTAQ